MGFQKGDQIIFIGNQRIVLRLTMGALAEISERLLVKGPSALMAELTVLDMSKARSIFECLMKPCLDTHIVMTDGDILNALPKICEVFEYAFG